MKVLMLFSEVVSMCFFYHGLFMGTAYNSAALNILKLGIDCCVTLPSGTRYSNLLPSFVSSN